MSKDATNKPTIKLTETSSPVTITKEKKKKETLESLTLDLDAGRGSSSFDYKPPIGVSKPSNSSPSSDPKRRPQTLVPDVERNKSFNYSTPEKPETEQYEKVKHSRALSFSRRNSATFDLSQQQQLAKEKAIQLREQV
jgi:hypothetical protein